MSSVKPKIAVLGSGSFGTAIANLISVNQHVYLYSRSAEKAENIAKYRINANQKVLENVIPTADIETALTDAQLLFPVVPSASFRAFIKTIAPYLVPQHILIHGTKGFDVSKAPIDENDEHLLLERKQVRTMSEVILEETIVLKVGVISGPNLAKEISEGQPAAAVIASKFDAVFKAGSQALKSRHFQIVKSNDIIGAEIAGTLKNIMAIGAGILSGMGYGNNALAMLISRGLNEVIRIGTALGGNTNSFLGLAGLGDLIATCSSPLSRNFTLGSRLAKGETLPEIMRNSTEVIEGIKTVMITRALANKYKIKIPITNKIFEVLFKQLPAKDGIQQLMLYRNLPDIDFV